MKSRKNIVVIPMVVGRQKIFGVLQFEGVSSFDEGDLLFISTVANQLAIALDRHKARKEGTCRPQRGGIRCRTNEVSGRCEPAAGGFTRLSGDLGKHGPSGGGKSIADFCIIDMLNESGSFERTTVRSSRLPDTVPPDLLKRALDDVVDHSFHSRKAIVHPLIPEIPATEGEETTSEETLNGSGPIVSYMCVPLRINAHALGKITMVSVRPGHLYKITDLILLEDLARRTVTAFENAEHYANALRATRSRDDVLNTVSHDLGAPSA